MPKRSAYTQSREHCMPVAPAHAVVQNCSPDPDPTHHLHQYGIPIHIRCSTSALCGRACSGRMEGFLRQSQCECEVTVHVDAIDFLPRFCRKISSNKNRRACFVFRGSCFVSIDRGAKQGLLLYSTFSPVTPKTNRRARGLLYDLGMHYRPAQKCKRILDAVAIEKGARETSLIIKVGAIC